MTTYVLSAAEMRELDRITIEEIGIPAALLMDHAGRAVAAEVAKLAPAGARVAVVCGSGNNGGDGMSCARWLRERGYEARVLLAKQRPKAGGAAALHLLAWEKLGGAVVDGVPDAELAAAAVIVDALLGTGLERDVEGELAAVIERVNAAHGVRVAVDLPSGISSDTGRTLGVSVSAQHTVTLAFPKIGVITWPGCERAGEVMVADIGIPRSLADKLGLSLTLLDAAAAARLAPHRAIGAHKGTAGHVLIAAGSPGKSGAALLAATGALRAGAGLVTLATAPAARESVDGRVAEVMTASLDLEDRGAVAALERLAQGKRAVVIGPGIPTSDAAGEHVRALPAALEVPLVIDADGLNHLAKDRAVLLAARGPVILTPHPGEAARLLGCETAEVQADRLGAARRLAAETRAIVVLKGARTVIARPDGAGAINTSGNPAMATGGTGDVLAGAIGALVAQGLDPFAAARLGVWAHGRAGDLAVKAAGKIGIVAGDVAAQIPHALTF